MSLVEVFQRGVLGILNRQRHSGAVAAHKVQRRLRPDGPWTDVGLAKDSETMLTAQERAEEWGCCVSAVNKAGEGAPSNTVMAVL